MKFESVTGKATIYVYQDFWSQILVYNMIQDIRKRFLPKTRASQPVIGAIAGVARGLGIRLAAKGRVRRLPTNKPIQRRELPTASDLLEHQKSLVQERLMKTLQQNHYDDYHTVIADVAAEGYDLVDIAAAALKLSIEGFKDAEEEQATASEGFGDTGGAPGMVRLFLNIGRSQKIRPSDVVRAIATEADIPGDTIGVINIYDKFTFVEVPEDVAERVMSIMHRNTVKGYKINVEPARKR